MKTPNKIYRKVRWQAIKRIERKLQENVSALFWSHLKQAFCNDGLFHPPTSHYITRRVGESYNVWVIVALKWRIQAGIWPTSGPVKA